MWNNWVEKAKNVAANIDKQINESVGMDDDGGFLSTPTAQPTEENVWSEDFDDQGFDADPAVQQQLPSFGSTLMEASMFSAQSVSKPEMQQASANVVPIPSTPTPNPSSQAKKLITPTASGSPARPDIAAAAASPTEDVAREGWGNDGDALDLNVDDDVVDFQQSTTVPDASAASSSEDTTKLKALETASSMLSSFSTSAAPMSSLLSTTAASTTPMSSLLKSTAAAFSTPAASIIENKQHHSEEATSDTHLIVTGDVSATPSTSIAAVPVEESQLEAVASGEPDATGESPTPGEEGWDGAELQVDGEGLEEAPTMTEDPKTRQPEELQSASNIVKDSTPPEDDLAERETVSTAISESKAATDQTIDQETVSTPTNKDLGNSTLPLTQTPVDFEDDPRYKELLEVLKLREDQLTSKSEQLTELQTLWETQEQELRQKIQDTKDEAKKRILRAKERCEAAENKLKKQSTATAESGAQSDQLISELRAEGEKLARKQSEMERSLRNAKAECRELREQVESETEDKEQALEKVAGLEVELKETKENLVLARKGESQVGKLESDLLSARSDADLKAASILSLEQQVKELKAEAKELKEGIMNTRKGAEQDAERESKKLRREHNDAIADLETKLRTSEREAGVREDGLRHEVSELRKRWQDAVRRADALSMDVQSSTAPLLRQLESMERQNRSRAAAWAELENKLRSELEETVIQNENMSKERSEFRTKCTRLERVVNERDAEIKECRSTIETQTAKLAKLEKQLEDMEEDATKRQEEYTRVEKLANEGVARVRSEMTQTVVESEERYRGQIEKLEGELRVEKEKRDQLEGQVSQLLDNAGMIVAPQAPNAIRREAVPRKLRETEGQANILAGALGFDDSDGEEGGDANDATHRSSSNDEDDRPRAGMNSFAALEQLSSRLKIAKVELEALRANLRESEKTRDSLVEELAESRLAKEKLPLFEAKVKELTEDNREKELELQGLRYDIAEVRELYRAQLNILLEEKAAGITTGGMNGASTKQDESESKPAEEISSATENLTEGSSTAEGPKVDSTES